VLGVATGPDHRLACGTAEPDPPGQLAECHLYEQAVSGEAFGLGRSDVTRAEIKGALAAHGHSMSPTARVEFISRGDSENVVLVERLADCGRPDYCTHGYATCVMCGELCWLGDETFRVVSERRAIPLCVPCARGAISRDARPIGTIRDHRRSDGPH
jgi:hypothetical protein